MERPSSQGVTHPLLAWGQGEQAALDKLVPLVHAEFRRLARRHMGRERPGHTLQATALVNEVYLQLVDVRNVAWHDRVHFFAVSSTLMRRILVDFARSRRSLKRGGGAQNVTFDEGLIPSPKQGQDLVLLDDALNALAIIASSRKRSQD